MINAKKEYKLSIKFIVVWTLIHITFNLFVFIWGRFIYDYEMNFNNDFSYLLKNLLLQILFFYTITFLFLMFLKWKRIALYSFAIVQSFFLHFLFIKKIDSTDEGFKFVAQFGDFELKYLEINLQEFTNIISYYFPFTGIFDGGFFVPDNTLYFYLIYVFTILFYYFLLTIISLRITNNSSLKFINS